MFARMKQKVREATGKAVATQLPEDIQAKMSYCEAWEGRDKKLITAINDITENWKKNKHRAEMLKAAEEIASENEGILKESFNVFGSYLKLRIDKEKKAYDASQEFEKKIKTFFCVELKTLMDAVKILKRKRLTRDAAEADYNSKQNDERQRKYETSEVEYQAAVKDLRTKMEKISELDQMHVDAVYLFMDALAEAHMDDK